MKTLQVGELARGGFRVTVFLGQAHANWVTTRSERDLDTPLFFFSFSQHPFFLSLLNQQACDKSDPMLLFFLYVSDN